MDCPKCVGILESKNALLAKGVAIQVDVCPMCEGHWFDKGELSKVLRVETASVWDFTWDLPSRKEAEGDLSSKLGKCPRCAKEMVRVPSMEDARVPLDWCASCGGYWCDGGELKFLAGGGPFTHAIRGVLKRVNAFVQTLGPRHRKNAPPPNG